MQLLLPIHIHASNCLFFSFWKSDICEICVLRVCVHLGTKEGRSTAQRGVMSLTEEKFREVKRYEVYAQEEKDTQLLPAQNPSPTPTQWPVAASTAPRDLCRAVGLFLNPAQESADSGVNTRIGRVTTAVTPRYDPR